MGPQQWYTRDTLLSQKEDQILTVLQRAIPILVGQSLCREATLQDPSLQAIRTYITAGLPSHRKAVPGPVRPYWTVRHDLTEKDGILFKGSQAVVPTTLRLSVLESIHDGYFGIMKSLVRTSQELSLLARVRARHRGQSSELQ